LTTNNKYTNIILSTRQYRQTQGEINMPTTTFFPSQDVIVNSTLAITTGSIIYFAIVFLIFAYLFYSLHNMKKMYNTYGQKVFNSKSLADYFLNTSGGKLNIIVLFAILLFNGAPALVYLFFVLSDFMEYNVENISNE
jgi:hypothetical protein